jgi:GT2 family glycosyltransferase
MNREPIVDVILLVHDQVEWAEIAVKSIEAFTRNPYRLIIVDSASEKPETKSWFFEMAEKGHYVVHLSENRSFSAGINAGVAVGSARYIVIFNSDAIATEGWDSALLTDVSDRSVGLAGARSNAAAGYQGDPSAIGEPPFIVFVCAALRRDVWNAVGPMDAENFDGFSGEDLDYSWRVKKAGYKLKVSDAYVLHAGSRTLISTVGALEDRARNDQKYQRVLADKWGKDWFREHTQAKKGLVVTYHADEWTRVDFMKHVVMLRAGGHPFEHLTVQRAPIHVARQLAMDYATDQGFDWVLQLDNDAIFPPDVIRRLLAHDREIVTALAYQRKPPHGACIFEIGPDGLMGNHLEGWERTGLRKVDISGFHCSLTRTSVIKKMRDAGIKQYFGGFDNKVGEDFAFSINAKKIGIQLYCDTGLISGHIGDAIIVDEEYKARFLASEQAKMIAAKQAG